MNATTVTSSILRRAGLHLLLPIVAVFVALLSTTGLAHANPLEPEVRQLPESTSEVQKFWTPERLRSAKAAEMPSGKGSERSLRNVPGPTGAPRGGHKAPPAPKRLRSKPPRSTHSAQPGRSLRWSGREIGWNNISYSYTSATKAVGRLFYTMPSGYRNFCSASVVATNVIMTAAHCVQNGKTGAYNSLFEFIPAVYGTSKPYGSFTGRATSVYTGWASPSYNNTIGTGGWGYQPMDYAFITLRPNAGGYNVGQYTGWYGLWPNAPKGTAYVLGYPGEGSWAANQNLPYHCKSPIQEYNRYYESRYDVGLSCYNTGGSSGGPWFLTASDGRAYVASVMSHMGVVKWQQPTCTWEGCARYGTTFYGPYLNNETVNLFNLAKAK